MKESAAAYDDENVYFKIRYISPMEFAGIWVRFPGNRDEFEIERYATSTKIGENTLILKFTKNELLNYKSSINIEVGDDHSIQLDQNVIEGIANKIKTIAKEFDNIPKITRKQAMLAKCYDCCGYFSDGRADCELPGCPQYGYMIYAKN